MKPYRWPRWRYSCHFTTRRSLRFSHTCNSDFDVRKSICNWKSCRWTHLIAMGVINRVLWSVCCDLCAVICVLWLHANKLLQKNKSHVYINIRSRVLSCLTRTNSTANYANSAPCGGSRWSCNCFVCKRRELSHLFALSQMWPHVFI